MGLNENDPLTFDLLAKLKGIFPSNKYQFCTEHLKLRPQKRWLEQYIKPPDDYIRYTGVRRDESNRRSDTKIEKWDEYFDCPMVCPIADWTKKMCFDYVVAHGEKYNQLYTLGFNRVGCAPCINSNKDDIFAWAQRFPEMIDKVRIWEQKTGLTFFRNNKTPGNALNWIDYVVAWSKTEHGGKQLGLKNVLPLPNCESKYGLCE